jgi:hypothetical protein
MREYFKSDKKKREEQKRKKKEEKRNKRLLAKASDGTEVLSTETPETPAAQE